MNKFEDVPATTVVAIPLTAVDFNSKGEAIPIPSRSFVTPASPKEVEAVLTEYAQNLAKGGKAFAWVSGGNTVVVYAHSGQLQAQFLEILGAVNKSIGVAA